MKAEFEKYPALDSEEEAEKGLQALVAYGFDAKRAAKRSRIPAKRIEGFKETHPELWARICEEHAALTRSRHAASYDELTDDIIPTLMGLVARARAKMAYMEPREAASAAANIAKVLETAEKYAAVHRGRPTEIKHQSYSLEMVNRAIAQLEAETVVDVEVVED